MSFSKQLPANYGVSEERYVLRHPPIPGHKDPTIAAGQLITVLSSQLDRYLDPQARAYTGQWEAMPMREYWAQPQEGASGDSKQEELRTTVEERNKLIARLYELGEEVASNADNIRHALDVATGVLRK